MGYTVYEFARLANAVYLSVAEDVDGWIPVQSFGVIAAGGFFARLYNKDVRWILAIRGTDEPHDWWDDADIFLGDLPSQIGPAQDALRRAKFTVKKEQRLCLTGHSLGGGLAAMLAVDSGLHAVTFDAPGVARAYGGRIKLVPIIGGALAVAVAAAAYTDRIINIRASFDIVSIGTGPRFGRVDSVDVAGCGPFAANPIGSPRSPHWRQSHNYGQPSLESRSWQTFTSLSTYPVCQHRMALMERELQHHPEYNRDLGW